MGAAFCIGALLGAAVLIGYLVGQGRYSEDAKRPEAAVPIVENGPSPTTNLPADPETKLRGPAVDSGSDMESDHLADLIEKVEPSVVRINVTKPDGSGNGSGFLVDAGGTVVTNYHVIEGATEAEVVFQDGTTAEVIGCLKAVPSKDLAILWVELSRDGPAPIPLATALPRKGEKVVAFGSPLGLSRSVSEGIVGAIRNSSEMKAMGLSGEVTWIQTTAPISPGNSGGPLVNMKGEVVGVTTSGFLFLAQNLNFAVSSIDVEAVLRETSDVAVPLTQAPRPEGNARTPVLVDLRGAPKGKEILGGLESVAVLVLTDRDALTAKVAALDDSRLGHDVEKCCTEAGLELASLSEEPREDLGVLIMSVVSRMRYSLCDCKISLGLLHGRMGEDGTPIFSVLWSKEVSISSKEQLLSSRLGTWLSNTTRELAGEYQATQDGDAETGSSRQED